MRMYAIYDKEYGYIGTTELDIVEVPRALLLQLIKALLAPILLTDISNSSDCSLGIE